MNVINKPTVSVIMPAYNVEKYISNAIESIINQTYKDWELIIVDDGSSDNTLKVISEYSDKDNRIRVFKIPHSGRGRARNICLQHCTGKYIAICDSDDICLPNRFEKQVKYLNENPEIGIVSSSKVICIDEQSKPLFEMEAPETTQEIHKTFDRNQMGLINPAAMIRSDLFKIFGGFDENLLRAQDYGFYKKVCNKVKFAAIPEPLVLYRTSGLTLPKKYFYETDSYRYYATYRVTGGILSFAEFYSNFKPFVYKKFVIPLKYLWFLAKRKILRIGVVNIKK